MGDGHVLCFVYLDFHNVQCFSDRRRAMNSSCSCGWILQGKRFFPLESLISSKTCCFFL